MSKLERLRVLGSSDARTGERDLNMTRLLCVETTIPPEGMISHQPPCCGFCTPVIPILRLMFENSGMFISCTRALKIPNTALNCIENVKFKFVVVHSLAASEQLYNKVVLVTLDLDKTTPGENAIDITDLDARIPCC